MLRYARVTMGADALFQVSRDWETALAQYAVRCAMVNSALDLIVDAPVAAAPGGGGGAGGGAARSTVPFREAVAAMATRPDDGVEYVIPGGKYVPLMRRPRGGAGARAPHPGRVGRRTCRRRVRRAEAGDDDGSREGADGARPRGGGRERRDRRRRSGGRAARARYRGEARAAGGRRAPERRDERRRRIMTPVSLPG